MDKLMEENFMLKALKMKKHIENNMEGEAEIDQEIKDLEEYESIFYNKD